MNVSAATLAVLRFQYRLARFPLQLIEDRAVSRLDTEAAVRLAYERSLAKLDVTVGGALGDVELSEAGTALLERSDKLARAAELDATATARKQQADTKLKSVTDAAIEDRNEARAATTQTVREARGAAQQRKQEAAQHAQERVEATARRVDEDTAERKRQVESAKHQDEQRIRAAEDAGLNASKAKLDDAQEKRSAAASKRAAADRVEELADAEKDNRRAQRGNNGS